MLRLTLISLLLLLHATSGATQERTVAFYNVENLFDTLRNPSTLDQDMLPLADKEWNSHKYNAKLHLLGQTIASISDDYPTLLGLAEVENRTVVQALASTPHLSKANYAICHYDSPDERGIDVALLYRPDIFHYEGSRALRSEADPATRDILTVWGRMDGHPTFIVVVHWPSRIGGVKFTEPKRRASARQVRQIVDSVMTDNPATRIIVMGDMNDNPRDKSIMQDLRAMAHPTLPTDLYNPFTRAKRGSSVYDGRWNQYDNIVVSQNVPLLQIEGKRRAKNFHHPMLLTRAGKPRPTYSGVEYKGGASDHLPIYIIIGERFLK